MMKCKKVKECKFGNNINSNCIYCINYYEGVRYIPANTKDLFTVGTPMKLVLFCLDDLEKIKKEYLETGKTELDFYKDFYEHLNKTNHFRVDVTKIDG